MPPLKRIFVVINTSVGQIPGLPPGNGRPRTQNEFPPGWNIQDTITEVRRLNLLAPGQNADGRSFLWTGSDQEFIFKVLLQQVHPNPIFTWVSIPLEEGDDIADPANPGIAKPDDQ